MPRISRIQIWQERDSVAKVNILRLQTLVSLRSSDAPDRMNQYSVFCKIIRFLESGKKKAARLKFVQFKLDGIDQ